MENKNKVWMRVFVMFTVLIAATAAAIFAFEGYGPYEYYIADSEYIDFYSPEYSDYYRYDNNGNEQGLHDNAEQAYGLDMNMYSYGQDSYGYDYGYNLCEDIYDYGGYIGNAPSYIPIHPLSTVIITFNPNGGTPMNEGHQTRTVSMGGTIGLPVNMPMEPGWPGGAARVFAGWNTESDYSGSMFTHATVVTTNITVYAIWGFEVFFQGNGVQLSSLNPANPNSLNCFSRRLIWVGTDYSGNSVYWSFDDTYGVALPVPTRIGFHFAGWYDTHALTGGNRTDSDTLVTLSGTLYARWVEAMPLLVNFDMQGGVLQPGTLSFPHRAYRWAWYGMSVAASSAPNIEESARLNINRIWDLTAPPGTRNFTPFSQNPSTSVVNPVPTGTTAATTFQMSTPFVLHPDTWVPPTAPGHPSHPPVQRLVISGWWHYPGGWENNELARTLPPPSTNQPYFPAPLVNPLWAQAQTPPVSTAAQYHATTIVTQDNLTVYAHYIWRITFNAQLGASMASEQGFSVFYTANSSFGNFRDVIAGSPRTINEDGRRIRMNNNQHNLPGGGGVHISDHAGAPVIAGMPLPGTVTRSGHTFNGWWCTNIPASSDPNTPLNAGAREFTGDSVIGCPCTNGSACPNYAWKGGSRTVFAHWVINVLQGATVHFNLNVEETGDGPGQAFWPTHRPHSLDGQVTDRYFLSRQANAYFGILGPDYWENITNNTSLQLMTVHNAYGMQVSNIHYNDRYEMQITRHYVANRGIQGMEQVERRMPRNPVRPGYVFMGWYCNPNGPDGPYGDGDGVRLLPSHILEPDLVKTVYARWVESFDLVFHANDGSGRLVVRNIAIGYSINNMNQAGRWIPTLVGQIHSSAYYSLGTAGFGFALGEMFTRAGFNVLGDYNFYPSPMVNGGHLVLDQHIVFTPERLEQYGTVDANGRISVPVFQQWTSVLTFNANLYNVVGGAGTNIRTATIAEGRSVNMVLTPPFHHPQQPSRGNVWGTTTTQTNPAFWFGQNGQVTFVNATRGGWPVYRPLDLPLRGGHWPVLGLPSNAWNLIGWSTDQTGQDPDAWVTADTIIAGAITFYAIWGRYLVFNPGIAGNEAINMPNPLMRPVDIGAPPHSVLPNFPGPPYWPGDRPNDHVFRGWNAGGPLGGGANLTADTQIAFARTYYAQWSANVRWHASLTNAPGAYVGGLPHGVYYGPNLLYIGTPFNVLGPGNQLSRTDSTGTWILQMEGGVPQWFALDPNAPNGRRFYTSAGPGIMRATDLYPNWIARIVFMLNGGRFASNPSNVTRQVAEGLTLNSNTSPNRAPENVTRDGHIFLGWRQVDINGYPIDPYAAPLSNDEANDMPTTTAFKWFEAVWREIIEIDFNFYKVNNSGELLNGATLYLFVYNGDGSPSLTKITPDMTTGQNPQWTRVAYRTSSNAAMVFTMTPDRYYQLVEVSPPAGYQMPMGQWRITVVEGIHPAPATLDITAVGGEPMPNITPGNAPETYLVLNWAVIILPMTGGMGTRLFMYAGVFVILLSTGIVTYMKIKPLHANKEANYEPR
ncbi:MAG: InlB B-repeat-containing protein [Defluviitaleaceae bacterium]|nr:InlB B-repeat-containing protein [Defluviitaleaceae bacterium]